MNTANTIIAALGGTTGVGALVAALIAYLKSKTAAEDRKRETAAAHKKMAEDMAALRADFAKMEAVMQVAVNEAASLRADGKAKDAEIVALKKDNAKLIDRVPPAIKPIERKT